MAAKPGFCHLTVVVTRSMPSYMQRPGVRSAQREEIERARTQVEIEWLSIIQNVVRPTST